MIDTLRAIEQAVRHSSKRNATETGNMVFRHGLATSECLTPPIWQGLPWVYEVRGSSRLRRYAT